MKKYALMMVMLVVGLSMAVGVFAADKDAIKMQVDEIAVAIDGGKTAADFKDAAKKEPYYVYILEEDGMVLVHPSLVGKSLKEAAMPAYEAVSKATPEGTWVCTNGKARRKTPMSEKLRTVQSSAAATKTRSNRLPPIRCREGSMKGPAHVAKNIRAE